MDSPLGLEDQIVVAIRRIIRAVDLHSRQLTQQFGLTGPQLSTLQECARLGRATVSALARATHLGKPTMSGILMRLEARALVRRVRSARDRRAVEIEVSEAGRDVLARSPSLLQDRFRRELGGIDDWERHQMLAVLQRIAAMMDAKDLDAAPHLVTDEIAGAAPEAKKPRPGARRRAR